MGLIKGSYSQSIKWITRSPYRSLRRERKVVRVTTGYSLPSDPPPSPKYILANGMVDYYEVGECQVGGQFWFNFFEETPSA